MLLLLGLGTCKVDEDAPVGEKAASPLPNSSLNLFHSSRNEFAAIRIDLSYGSERVCEFGRRRKSIHFIRFTRAENREMNEISETNPP
jgi:hypothetical protein